MFQEQFIKGDTIKIDIREQCSVMFTNYHDVINIEQMRTMLGGISLTLAYRLIKENKKSLFKSLNKDFIKNKCC